VLPLDEMKLNLLVAYPYFTKEVAAAIKRRESETRLFVDSGAFTAWKAGKPIALDDYCRFLESLPITPWRYFALDIVGDPHGSMRNYELMLKRGFKPVPVFTRGEDPSVFDDYYKTTDLVGIGGLVQTPKAINFVKGVMQKTRGRNVHLLGFGNADAIAWAKPYSFDSSSWSSGVRFGAIHLYDRNGVWLKKFTYDDLPRLSENHKRVLAIHGCDPSQLADREQWKNAGDNKRWLQIIPARAWVRYMIDIRLKLKSHFFLAVTSEHQANHMINAWDYWRPKK
jgi:hypothetical protein